MKNSNNSHSDETYNKNSLSLIGSVSMGTGVMIGAGIFALTGQVAEQAGGLFPLAFLAAAIVAGFSAYSYVKMAEQYPSAGGVAMFLMKAYVRDRTWNVSLDESKYLSQKHTSRIMTSQPYIAPWTNAS